MKLKWEKVIDREDLVPESIITFARDSQYKDSIMVAEIDPAYADGEGLSREYEIPVEMELNCLIVEGTRGEEKRYAALVVPYGRKANTNAVVRRPLNAKKVTFADLDYVVKETGMEYGAVTPVGLPSGWIVLCDASVFEQKTVVVGGGYAKAKILMPSEVLKTIPGMQVVEGLAR